MTNFLEVLLRCYRVVTVDTEIMLTLLQTLAFFCFWWFYFLILGWHH